MRLIHFIFTCTCFLFSFCSGTDREVAVDASFDTAVEYNEFIIGRQGKIVGQIMSVADMMGKDTSTAQARLREGVRVSDSALADLGKLGAFKGDSVFRNAARASFLFYRRLFASEYPTVIRMQHDSLQERASEELHLIRQSLEAEEAELDKKLGSAQFNFAKKNNMPLLQNGGRGNTK